MDRIGALVDLTAEQREAFGHKPQVVAHRLHRLGIFDDDALTALIDRYPRQWLQAFTMGTDPEKREDWAPVEIGECSGVEILEAVKRGRLWLNTEYAEGRRAIQTAARWLVRSACPAVPGLSNADPQRDPPGLFSGAQVYYHVDGPPNFLWHIRGEKRVYIYPPGDRRLVSQEIMEDVFASVADEEMPYERAWDSFAVVYPSRTGSSVALASSISFDQRARPVAAGKDRRLPGVPETGAGSA